VLGLVIVFVSIPVHDSQHRRYEMCCNNVAWLLRKRFNVPYTLSYHACQTSLLMYITLSQSYWIGIIY